MADVRENQIYLNGSIMIFITRNMLMAQLHLGYFLSAWNRICFALTYDSLFLTPFLLLHQGKPQLYNEVSMSSKLFLSTVHC